MTLIARFYKSKSKARSAKELLLKLRFHSELIDIIEPPAKRKTAKEGEKSDDGAQLALMAVKLGAILGEEASKHVANLSKGYTLLAVRAPFGRALQAASIMDDFEPVASAGADLTPTPSEPFEFITEKAAPLSHVLGLPVIFKKPMAMTEYLGLQPLTEQKHFLTGNLARHNSFFSDRFGWSLLSSEPAPLSKRFDLSLKSGKSGAGWTHSFGFKMLSSNAAPLSGFFGIPLISGQNDSRSYAPPEHRRSVKDPAPLSNLLGLDIIAKTRESFMASFYPLLSAPGFSLSSLFGFPLLSKNPTPLSSLLGLPVTSGKSGKEFKYSFGYPVLSSKAAPLSALLGWPVKAEGRTFHE